MHVVVNRVQLKEPIEEAVFEAAQREMPARVSEIAGIRSFHVARAGDAELLVVIVGDDEGAIERMRDEVGNEWMRATSSPTPLRRRTASSARSSRCSSGSGLRRP